MRFARLVEAPDVESAADALRAAELSGFERVWLVEGRGPDPRMVLGRVTPRELGVVLQLDPANAPAVPRGLPLELAVDGTDGWEDDLRGLLEAVGLEPDPPTWVLAHDAEAAAAAARAGVAAVLDNFNDPDQAVAWTDRYEAALTSDEAAAIGRSVNAGVAVIVPSGDDPGELVGLVERYREAGVDEVVLTGPAAADPEFVHAVIAEFDDDEVRAAAAAKAARIAPALAALESPPEVASQPEGTADGAPAEPRRRRPLSSRIADLQLAVVQRMSDRWLEFFVGNRLGVAVLLQVMARLYRPAKAGGFTGSIEFTLKTRRRDEVWTIDCGERGAKARHAASPAAKLRIEAGIANFLRVGVGQVPAPSAVLGGKLEVRGDFGLALRMGEMFGGSAIT